jgi:competence protein ComEA
VRSEHRTILALLALAVVGHFARWCAGRPADAPGGIAPLGGLVAGNPAAQRDSTRRLARPLGPGERVNVDRAGADELARLPRVGPGLARRIVADRLARGPFGSLAALDRVPGVGPRLLQEIAPHVVFGAGGAHPPP